MTTTISPTGRLLTPPSVADWLNQAHRYSFKKSTLNGPSLAVQQLPRTPEVAALLDMDFSAIENRILAQQKLDVFQAK